MNIISRNTRTPHYNEGDLKALMAAMNVAEKRLDQTIDKYGLAGLPPGDRRPPALRRDPGPRRHLRIPDGAYEMAGLHGAGHDRPGPCPHQAQADGLGIECISTSAVPTRRFGAALNLPTFGKNHHFINAGVFNFIYAIDNSIPLNRGILRPIQRHHSSRLPA